MLLPFLALIVTACAERQRINPLDPRNVETGGRPSGVRVISIQDTVFLSWDAISLDDLRGFQVYRKAEDDTAFLPVQFTRPSRPEMLDTTVELGVEYAYRVSAVGFNYESDPSEPVTVTPGPTFNWVADNQARVVVQLTHDARHPIRNVGRFATITHIEVDPVNGHLWLINRFSSIDGSLVQVLPDGTIAQPIVRFSAPVDAALDERSGAVWVADSRERAVRKVDLNGTVLFSIGSFSQPVSVDVDQRDGTCWVADKGGKRIGWVSSDGLLVGSLPITFEHLSHIEVNSADGTIWVADSTRVVRVVPTDSTALEVAHEFALAQQLAVDDLTGEVWVLDFRRPSVSKISAMGTLEFERPDFSRPFDLAVNRFDHTCLVADAGARRLVRIAPSGETVAVFDDIGVPEAVAVQNVPLSEALTARGLP